MALRTRTPAETDTRAPLRGSSGQVFDVDGPDTTRSKSKLPEIALGVLLVAVFALGGLYLQTTSGEKTVVIALANPVERGEVVALEDLTYVSIGTDDPINVLGQNDSGVVVGRVALNDMAAGTLITGEHVTGGSVVELGDGVVGMALEPGEFPSLSMRSGDVVSVVLMPSANDPAALDGDLAQIAELAEQQILVDAAVVVEVAPIGQQGSLFVSLTMEESEAALVARAASQNRIRLVEISEEAGS